MLQQAVGDESVVLWSQNDAKQLFLEDEGHDGTRHHGDNHLYQAVAQFVEVIPKGHVPICKLLFTKNQPFSVSPLIIGEN